MGAPRKEPGSFLKGIRVKLVSEFKENYRSALGEKARAGEEKNWTISG